MKSDEQYRADEHKSNKKRMKQTRTDEQYRAKQKSNKERKNGSGHNYHSFGTTKSRGVSILISDKFTVKEDSIFKDHEG